MSSVSNEQLIAEASDIYTSEQKVESLASALRNMVENISDERNSQVVELTRFEEPFRLLGVTSQEKNPEEKVVEETVVYELPFDLKNSTYLEWTKKLSTDGKILVINPRFIKIVDNEKITLDVGHRKSKWNANYDTPVSFPDKKEFYAPPPDTLIGIFMADHEADHIDNPLSRNIDFLSSVVAAEIFDREEQLQKISDSAKFGYVIQSMFAAGINDVRQSIPIMKRQFTESDEDRLLNYEAQASNRALENLRKIVEFLEFTDPTEGENIIWRAHHLSAASLSTYVDRTRKSIGRKITEVVPLPV